MLSLCSLIPYGCEIILAALRTSQWNLSFPFSLYNSQPTEIVLVGDPALWTRNVTVLMGKDPQSRLFGTCCKRMWTTVRTVITSAAWASCALSGLLIKCVFIDTRVFVGYVHISCSWRKKGRKKEWFLFLEPFRITEFKDKLLTWRLVGVQAGCWFAETFQQIRIIMQLHQMKQPRKCSVWQNIGTMWKIKIKYGLRDPVLCRQHESSVKFFSSCI